MKSVLNLITSDWLPVLRASGHRQVVAVHQLTDGSAGPDPIVSLDFGRPDLDGAVTELLIGLIAVAMGPQGVEDWADVWQLPPSPEILHKALAPLAFAFNLGGDGPRCFQDLDELQTAAVLEVSELLIDYKDETSFRFGSEHFRTISDPDVYNRDAAAALVTLQTYSPAGGRGYRTGLRGGGPLTTLARWPRKLPDERSVYSLWDTIWLNVPEVDGPPQLNELVFPWCATTQTSANGEVVTPELTGKLHAFFGMPRRIRLAFDDDCRASAYRTVGYGMNYSGWFGRHAHPLSPYYKDAKANTLPVHPRAGPTSYRDWLGILVNRDEAFRASCVNTAARRIAALGVRRNNLRPDILAFGYDQDNAKARGFSVQSVPWILAAQEKAFSDLMAVAVEASEASAKAVRYAVQMARHGEVAISDTGSASISVRDEGKKSGENVYHAFYAVSEPDFRNYLDAIAPLEFFEDSLEARGEFAKACRRIARQLFAEHVDMDGRDMRRTVLAEKWLGVALNSTKAKSYVFKSLQLEVQEARHV